MKYVYSKITIAKIPLNTIFFNRRDDFWVMLRNGVKKGLEGSYKLPIVRGKDFIQDCGRDDFVDFWKYHLRYSINSFSDKCLINQITKSNDVKT